MIRIVAAAATSIARAGVPNRECSAARPSGQNALGRKPLEQLLGVAQRGVGGRHEHQDCRDDEADCQDVAQPSRRGQMLRKTSHGRGDPGGLLCRRYQKSKQERGECCHEQREHQRQESGPAQCLHARRLQLVRRLGEHFPATNRGKDETEARQAGQPRVEVPTQRRDRRRQRDERRERRGRPHRADHTPQSRQYEHAYANPDAAGDRVRPEVQSDARPNPQQPHHHYREHRREVFRPEETCEPEPGYGRHGDT